MNLIGRRGFYIETDTDDHTIIHKRWVRIELLSKKITVQDNNTLNCREICFVNLCETYIFASM